MSAEPAIWITRVSDPGTGVPVAVKDIFDTKDLRTTYGSAVFADHLPRRSAVAVERLEAAGYAVAGKANLHEFGFGVTSQNPHYGPVPNPVAPQLTPGGSSGGSAAALAAGEADLGLGTDSGGSLRIPAACCGVVAMKPTYGLVPMAGCFPLAPSFDHAGPLARDVAGCASALRALAGVRPRAVEALSDLHVGVAWCERAEPEVRARVEAAATLFPRRRRVQLPLPEGVFPVFQHEIAGTHRELFAEHRASYGANVATKIERCLAVSGTEAAVGLTAREEYRERFAEAFTGLELILAPTLPMLPPPADADELEVRARMTQLTFPLNAVGAPALAMPCGRSESGAPVSLQLIGPPGDDDLVLAAAALLESALRHTAVSGRSRTPRKRSMSETETKLTTDQREREASGAHAYGRYLEEFEVGAVYKHWPAKTVTEADDHLFCLITMNHHPLHLNDVYASESQQGQNVVVGPLVYSLALGMSVSDVSGKAIANLATEELSHPNPVFHGDTLYCESEVLEVRPSQSKPDRGVVKVHTRVYKQSGDLVAEFKRAVLVPRRDPGDADHAEGPVE